MGKHRDRACNIHFWVTEEERTLIQKKMDKAGVRNMSAYLRKVAIDGYVVRLEVPELRDLISLLRRSGNNLNQLAKRVHETGRVYDADLEELHQSQQQLQEAADTIVKRLTEFL